MLSVRGAARGRGSLSRRAGAVCCVTPREFVERRQRYICIEWNDRMSATGPRYAIYFVPAREIDLYKFGTSIIGYDC